MKKISVIVPVYNTATYLEKCVNSICTQTHQNLEIVLVDDGSTDGHSSDLCDRLAEKDSRVRVLHKKNGGLSSARNAGLAVAKGDYITFVDSDDYLREDMYSQIFEVAADYLEDERTILCGGFVRVDENGKFLRSRVGVEKAMVVDTESYIKSLLMHKGDTSVCTKLFPKHLLDNHRFQEGRLNEDLLFMIELLPEVSRMVFSGERGYYYLCRTNSTSNGYGRAGADMVGNAEEVCRIVKAQYPNLLRESQRFLLVQQSAYLMLLPSNLRNKTNALYVDTLRNLRKGFIQYGWNNVYISQKNKFIIAAQTISPSAVQWVLKGKD